MQIYKLKLVTYSTDSVSPAVTCSAFAEWPQLITTYHQQYQLHCTDSKMFALTQSLEFYLLAFTYYRVDGHHCSDPSANNMQHHHSIGIDCVGHSDTNKQAFSASFARL